MFETFRNAWKIDDLRKRLLFTLLILVLFRLGSAIPVPNITADALDSMFEVGSMLNYLNMMSGGNLSNCTIFALGVQPYINATIIVQLLTVAIPYLENLAKEGEQGRRKLNRINNYVGAGIALVLSIGYYFVIRRMGALKYTDGFSGIFSAIVIVLCFTAGAQLVTWMGNQIDQKGIGNGISLLIFAGIVSRWSDVLASVQSMLTLAASGQSQYYIYLPVIVILALVAVVFVVILTNAERRIPVQYAKRVVGRKMYGGQNSYIPIKVNMSGVMPIIFASTLCGIPSLIGGFLPLEEGSFWYVFFHTFNYTSWVYIVVYLLLIIAFNYFYVAIQYNPVDIANQLRKNNGTIPGIRPGKPTSDFIVKTLNKITLIGALFLAIVAVLPIVLGNVTGVSIQLGGTSLLIVVGVALDTGRSLEGYMTSRHHKGFLE
ncbi:preprotein translocase subunit SecY [Subdoligranulum sp. DSM 109015]|uniref:Protein translocase subunit SecY n=1 Tax=Gemmiger gallinarum TaxID=2779354 RepID=A0ABR9R4K7_9FIRM|nr:preprotein translocase subunit SecY [Gemmiger gallinarum]MBE5038084.1 preprotein translocase subunit SecY [Gemmiger gallinarum]